MGILNDLSHSLADRITPPPVDPEVEERCPNLWEMLTVDRWGDDSERVLPRIMVDRVAGGYLVTIQDDSLLLKKTCFAARWEDIPKALETALLNPEAPWQRMDKSYRNKLGAKVAEKNGKATRRKKA